MLVICFTISDGEYKSITLLWIRIWKRSHVLEPSPQGVLRVVILKIFVGMRTGPFTFNFCFLAPLISSAHTEEEGWVIYTILSLYSKFYTVHSLPKFHRQQDNKINNALFTYIYLFQGNEHSETWAWFWYDEWEWLPALVSQDYPPWLWPEK